VLSIILCNSSGDIMRYSALSWLAVFMDLAVNWLKSRFYRLSSILLSLVLRAFTFSAFISFWATAAGLFSMVILTMLDLSFEDD
jgi:hypothetical protein